MLNNCRAQVGDTLTWVVATLIIIFILLISIFSLNVFSIFSLSNSSKILDSDLIIQKSAFAFLLSKASTGQTFFEKLKSQESLDAESEALLDKIFKENSDGKYYFSSFALYGYKMKFILNSVQEQLRDGPSYYGMDQPVYISENKFLDLIFYFPK